MRKLFEVIDTMPGDVFVAWLLLAVIAVFILYRIARSADVDHGLITLEDGNGRVYGVVKKVGYMGEASPRTLEGKVMKTRRLRGR